MSARRYRGRAPPRGFTLVEVLVAMALASLVLLALFGGMAIAVRGVAQLASASGRTDDGRQLALWLRREIEVALPPDLGGPARLPFAGEAAALRFLTMDAGGATEVSLALETAPAGATGAARLVLARRPVEGGLPTRVVLARDLAAVRFSYWGRPVEGGDAGWADGWSDPREIPTLVRVVIARPDGREELPVVVRLRAADLRAPSP
jgi:prepilin-type N-terminal cleavage/methylation domain-containing protein